MAKTFDKGDDVKWRWGEGWGQGTVRKVYTDDVTLKIKGTEVRREASRQAPAYKIEQSDGDEVLKSHSEVESAG